jgi:hypothetical protein
MLTSCCSSKLELLKAAPTEHQRFRGDWQPAIPPVWLSAVCSRHCIGLSGGTHDQHFYSVQAKKDSGLQN